MTGIKYHGTVLLYRYLIPILRIRMEARLMANVHDIRRHPTRVIARIRAYAADLDKVSYQRETINALVRDRIVLMTDIWECLESGELMEEYLHFEPDGTYAKLVCHTGDGTIYVDIKMISAEDKMMVLYAEKEDD